MRLHSRIFSQARLHAPQHSKVARLTTSHRITNIVLSRRSFRASHRGQSSDNILWEAARYTGQQEARGVVGDLAAEIILKEYALAVLPPCVVATAPWA